MSGSPFRSEPMSKGQVIALFRNDCVGNGNGSMAVVMISVAMAMANVIENFSPWTTFLPFSTFPVLLATRGGLQLRRPAWRAWQVLQQLCYRDDG